MATLASVAASGAWRKNHARPEADQAEGVLKIECKISQASVKVHVNDILHIHFMREKYIGIAAWQYEKESMFYIEITMVGGVITCDYDKREMWVAILAELEKAR